jgi:GT2 family glycosyltransferase
MDDDAWAEPDWLANLLQVLEQVEGVVAVGGPPLPEFESPRPEWFPRSFDWVFGCAYEGLPVETSPLRHLFAGNMAIRRDAMAAVGGFHSVDFDDLDMCMRLAERFGHRALYFEPAAIVHHYVPSDRMTWRYFYRRCFFVNRHKVQAFREMDSAANLRAELEFVAGTLRGLATRDLMRVARREPGAIRAIGAAAAGILLAGVGNLRGRFDPPLEEEVMRPKL